MKKTMEEILLICVSFHVTAVTPNDTTTHPIAPTANKKMVKLLKEKQCGLWLVDPEINSG